jgi:UDP-N-acetylmuramyl pentapeptide phosphotransferase/UDP-N-acetylglucosamine-1-phosphate transferase
MQYLIFYSSLLIIFLISRLVFKDLKSKFYKKHQKFAGKETIPLIGGIIIFCFLGLNFEYFDKYIIFFSFLILCLGISSDCNFINSPKIRLILQSSLIIIFVVMLNLNILDLRNELLNNLISNYYFNIIFISFCLLVLINGSNFIDGLDGLNLGYFLSILIVILVLNHYSKIIINDDQIRMLFCIVTFLFLLNIFNFLYLGDSGSYLIGFIFGYFLLELNDTNPLISPYFIALLLWYPAFENLFSIIRKKIINTDPLDADNSHLHQLLFNYFRIKKNKLIKRFSNPISSFIINIYNFLIFLVSLNYFTHTKSLLLIIALNVTIYLFFYYLLKKKLF